MLACSNNIVAAATGEGLEACLPHGVQRRACVPQAHL